MKKTADLEKMFENYILSKGLVSRYRKFSQNSIVYRCKITTIEMLTLYSIFWAFITKNGTPGR